MMKAFTMTLMIVTGPLWLAKPFGYWCYALGLVGTVLWVWLMWRVLLGPPED